MQINGPQNLNMDLVYILAHSMLEGNRLHEVLKSKGTLSDINLTVPEAIKYTGNKALGLTEWVCTIVSI